MPEEIKKLKNELEKSKTNYLYLLSEFDNYKKRRAIDELQIRENVEKELLLKILPVLDDLNCCIGRKDGFVMDLIREKFENILKSLGVTEIPCFNEHNTFDPNLHEAVITSNYSDSNQNEITSVFQKGYMYKDKVLRFSKVQVNRIKKIIK